MRGAGKTLTNIASVLATNDARLWPYAAAGAALGAAGVCAWGAARPSSQLFGQVAWRTGSPSEIALTFDDGPNPAMTPRLLELLERYAARATFFVVGRFAKACPELVREIAAQGHAIGNHTDTHPNLVWLLPSQIERQIAQCREKIAEALRGDDSANCNWMRPPWGFRGPQLASAVRRCGLRGVATWSVKCYDWRPQPPARLIERLGKVGARGGAAASAGNEKAPAWNASGKSGGDIVLLHDGDFRGLGADRSQVLGALAHWLPRWKDAGFKFVTMDAVKSSG